MGTRDKRVDAYIAKSADFARPILEHFRELVHATIPEADETIKWGMPFWETSGIVCNMAAFKAHCAIGFWQSGRVVGDAANRDAMGQLGRISSLADLPPKRTLVGYLKRAAEVRAAGASAAQKPAAKKAAAKKPAVKKATAVPDDFAAALRKNRKAAAVFEAFAPSHRREYVDWITEAKRPETRERRIAQAVEWIADGKQRNWKYM